MASSGSAVVTLPTGTEIRITREFDAPPALVWRAWTEPELVSQWWPGRRGQMRSCEIDLRVGGSWRYVMTASEGFEVAFHGTYLEIEPGARLVNTEVFEGVPPGVEPAVNANTFEGLDGGRTLLTKVTRVESQEVRDMIIPPGMGGGMQEGMDILEQLAIGRGATAAGPASAGS